MTKQSHSSSDLISDDLIVQRRRPLTVSDMERMRLPQRFWKAEIDRIKDKRAEHIIRRYISNMGSVVKPGEPMKNGYGILIWGENDTGKSSVGSILLKEARRRGFSCLFIRALQYRQSVFEKEKFDDAQYLNQRCQNVDMLVLDDFGKESSNEDKSAGGSERIYDDLIRGRCADLKSTIITMNNSPETLEERYKKSFVRLLSESFIIMKLKGESQREIEKQQMVNFYKK